MIYTYGLRKAIPCFLKYDMQTRNLNEEAGDVVSL